MMLDNEKTAHHVFSDEFNTFLLNITDPMIVFLQSKTKRDTFAPALRSICLTNELFSNPDMAVRNGRIDEQQKKVLDVISYLSSELSYYLEIAGCDVYNKDDYLRAFDAKFKEHVAELLQQVAELDFNALVLNSAALSDFKTDYTTTIENILSGAIDLSKAEASLACWRDAIPDNVLQDALLHMRYCLIKQLFEKYNFCPIKDLGK